MKQSESRTRLAKWLIFVLCVLQPVMNVLSFWLIEVGAKTDLTLVLRMLMLVGTVGIAFLLSEKKGVYLCLVGVGVLYYLLHAWACVRAGSFSGITPIVTDIANYVRVFQIPLFALSLMTLLHCAEDGYRDLENGMLWAFFLIAAVEVLSVLTDTNPYTYANKQIGIVGWFFFPNAQSAVLSMLFPLVLCMTLERGSLLRFSAVAVIGFAELYFFATRLSYLAIFIAAAGTVFFQLVNRPDRAKLVRVGVVLLCAVLCAAGYTRSPMYQNRAQTRANESVKQQELDALVEQGKAKYGEAGYEYLIPAYEYHQKNMLDRFGAETVIAAYDYSTEVLDIVNDRTKKLNYCRLLLQESPKTSAIFGVSYSEMVWNGENFDVENDFHGILYLYGYVGLGLLLLMLLWFVWQVLRLLLADWRRCFTPRLGALAASLAAGLIHAYCTAGMLRRPNASFYLSVTLAAVWLLTNREMDMIKSEGGNRIEN